MEATVNLKCSPAELDTIRLALDDLANAPSRAHDRRTALQASARNREQVSAKTLRDRL